MKDYKEIFQDAFDQAIQDGLPEERAAGIASNAITETYAAMADRARDERKERELMDLSED